MKKEMLINVLQPEECRIAIIEDGVLEELYVERTSHESYVGNIYKGRIVNIEPSIQAAFVDFGVGRNGFLHVSDVEPAYYRHLEQSRRSDRGGQRDRGRDSGRGDSGRGGRGRGRSSDRPERGRRQFEEERPMRPEQVAFPEEDVLVQYPDVEPLAKEEPTTFAEDQSPPEWREPNDTESSASEPPAPERRRGRGPSRRRQQETSEAPEAAAEQETPPSPSSEDKGDEEPPRTRFMESAEHRTEEGESSGGGDAFGSSSPGDDDLFFPRSQPSEAEPEPEPAPSYEPPPREETPRETFESEPEPREPFVESLAPEMEDDLEEELPVEDYAEEDLIPDLDAEIDKEPRHFRQREERGGREGREGREGHGGRDRRDNRRPGGKPNGGRRPFGRPGVGRPKPLIQDIFKRGQEVLVQVIKEGIGTKGPTLSTYISIAGRYLVLMPGLNRIGVSRKIQDDEQRRRLREIFNELKPPRGVGFIIRTAGIDRNKKELQGDLAYLSRLWQVVVRRIKKLKSPAEIYQESDMITRTIRDTFTNDIDTIWVDEPTAYEHAKEFCEIVMPRFANRIKLYSQPEPLFHKYGIEEEIVRIQQRHVPLPNGGSIVIEQTEALVAIDVNSGNFRADNNAEETAYQMNLQAAKEISRQLRLRDLGGVIVNDFIDMRDEKHRRSVERALRDHLKRDRARTKILRMSQFGIIEMTRQRIRPSLKRSVYQDCSHCLGTGQVKTCESMSIEVMRMMQMAAHRPDVQRIQIQVAEDVANYLHNKKRKEVTRLEESGNIQVTIVGVSNAPPEQLEFLCLDNNNNEVKTIPYDRERSGRREGR